MLEVFITACGKKDGFGSQTLSKILALLFCRKHGFTYVHTPLRFLDAKEQDISGTKAYNNNQGPQWVKSFENLLNIGHNEINIDNKNNYDIIIDLTDVIKTKQINMNNNYLWHDFDPFPLIQNYMKNIKSRTLFKIKEFPKIDIYDNALVNSVLNELIGKYKKNLNVKNLELEINNKFNIVIHKRHTRGNRLKRDTNLNHINNRVTLNNYYIEIIKKLRKQYENKDIEFWIYSDGNKSDFKEFEFIYENQAIINSDDPIKINFMLQTDSRKALNHFINADVLVLDKSSFGYVAGLYNENTVIYNPYWDKKCHRWI